MVLDLGPFLRGKGVDISQQRQVNGAVHAPKEVNNFFTIRDVVKPESVPFVYCGDVDATKFYRIVMKEMLIACKKGGYLIAKTSDHGVLNFNTLLEEVKACVAGKATVVAEDREQGVVVAEKTKPFLTRKDTIQRWTFGIITNGKRNEWVERQIASIRALNIPECEIVVCGTYFDREEEGFRYVPFNEQDEKGWITKKKNLICEAARFENVVVVHDRILFNANWYEGMKKYGNYFEALSCKILDTEGKRRGDWVTAGAAYKKFPKVGMLEYHDWDRYGYVEGALYILKKSVWEKGKWNEALFWNQAEDIELGSRWHMLGVVARFNPYASCTTLSWRHRDYPLYAFHPRRLSPYHWGVFDVKRLVGFYARKALGLLRW